jgi:hypothetical protein
MEPIIKTVMNMPITDALYITGKNSRLSFFFNRLILDSKRLYNDPDRNIYHTIEVPYFDVPGREDPQWKEAEIKNLGSEEKFRDEYDINWSSKPRGHDDIEKVFRSATRG